jgi:eukaryotic-like serine/threonine-protein kinase
VSEPEPSESRRPDETERCPDADTVLAFVGRTLRADTAARVERHIARCEACRVLVSAAVKEAYSAGTEPSSGPLQSALLGRGSAVCRYLVLDLIGRGGSSDVYAAYDPDLARRLALKLLHTAMSSREARARLVREARALGKLSHPNVVQVYDVGEHEGDVFIAMELVVGEHLGAWLRRAPRPTWQEVLAAYLEAARGLSAAHEEGLVHRDVKPSNIVRAADGRVRVVDFGLVGSHAADPLPSQAPVEVEGTSLELSQGDTLPAPSRAPSSSTMALTVEGTLMGTPRYMAPEQFEGARVGRAADQYSLCLALYEGLYGALPFEESPGASPHERLLALLANKRKGPAAVPPLGSPVPTWIHRALVRGLAPRPEDRYASMVALVAALREDPAAPGRARRRKAGLVAGAAVVLGLAGFASYARHAPPNPCLHAEQQLAGVWDPDVAARLRSTFAQTGRSYAESTTTSVKARLDAYAGDWARMRGEVCEASQKVASSREILALRDACLDRRRRQLAVLVGVLSERPDPESLDRAVAAATGLPPVASCADTESLIARVRLPEDPRVRSQVVDLESRVDKLEALHATGRYKEGLEFGAPLIEEARAVGYAPLLGRGRYWLGRLRALTGDDEGAKAMLRDAAQSAAEGGDDVLVANAWARVLYVLGEHQRRFEEASGVLAFGPTLLGRAHDDRAEAEWLTAEGLTLYRMGRYAEAKDADERAIAILEKSVPPEHPDRTAALNNLGVLLHDMGDDVRAKEIHERILALRERVLGADHPLVANSLNSLGIVLVALGDYARAEEAYRRALAIREKALGPRHAGVAMAMNNLADLFHDTGRYDEAKALHERALSIRQSVLEAGHPDIAQSLMNLGNVLYELGDYGGARELDERALAILEKRVPSNHPDLAYPLVALGRTLVRLGRFDAAQGALERARTLQEKSPTPLLGLGELDLARHRVSAAIPPLERALAMNDAETTVDVELVLAEALWQKGSDRARARDLATKARDAYERMGHRPGVARATRWLLEH